VTESASPLEEAIESLGFARHGTMAEAANIPDDRWDYRPHAEAKSVDELVRHMIEAAEMLVGELTDPEGDFQRRAPLEHVRVHARELPEAMTPAELREALSSSHDQLVAKLRAAGDELMARPIRRFDGGQWTRLTFLYHAIGHEEYHRGQLAMYARAMGLVPALTQLIHGHQAE